MKLQDVLVQLDHIKPNQYDDAMLVRWISNLDGYLYHEIVKWHAPAVNEGSQPEAGQGQTGGAETQEGGWDPANLPYNIEKDMDRELLVPAPYDDIYVKYLCAQVDFHNAEWTRYNNSMILYNTALSAYADWLNRENMPMQGAVIRI